MTWIDFVFRLYNGEEVPVTLIEGKKWFTRGTIANFNVLQQSLESRIKGVVITQMTKDTCTARTPTRIHPDYLDSPAQKLIDPAEVDRPYFESLIQNGKPEEVPVNTAPEAEVGRCHANVRHYVDTHEGYRPAPGWLFETSILGEPVFTCHSVVEGPDGQLVDVTEFPGQALQFRSRMKFCRHPGTSEEFRELRDKYLKVTLVE